MLKAECSSMASSHLWKIKHIHTNSHNALCSRLNKGSRKESHFSGVFGVVLLWHFEMVNAVIKVFDSEIAVIFRFNLKDAKKRSLASHSKPHKTLISVLWYIIKWILPCTVLVLAVCKLAGVCLNLHLTLIKKKRSVKKGLKITVFKYFFLQLKIHL